MTDAWQFSRQLPAPYLIAIAHSEDAFRRTVADCLGISFETLKTWGDRVRKGDQGKIDFRCARLAGDIGDRFFVFGPADIAKADIPHEGIGLVDLKHAEHIHMKLTDFPLNRLRVQLRRARMKQTNRQLR